MIGNVNLLVELHLLAVLGVAVFPVPAGGGRVGDVFVKTPVAGRIGHLPPFAGHAGSVAGGLENLGQRRLIFVRRIAGGLIRQATGAKAVAAGHDAAPRRAAEGSGVAAFVAGTGFGQGINVRRKSFGPVGAVAAKTVGPAVVAEDEQNVGPVGGRS